MKIKRIFNYFAIICASFVLCCCKTSEAKNDMLAKLESETSNETINLSKNDVNNLNTENDNIDDLVDISGTEDVKYNNKFIGICIYDFNDNFMSIYRDKIKKTLLDKNYQLEIVDAKKNEKIQEQQTDKLIDKGVSALIINPVSVKSIDSILQKAKKKNIPIVIINREPTNEQLNSYDKAVYVGCDARQSGTMQGEIIYNTLNHGDINGDGVVKYIMIEGDEENIDSKHRTEFSVKALVDNGMDVLCLDEQRGMWDRDKAEILCTKILGKYGYDIEVVFCNNDDMALGALKAINDNGRKVGSNIYLVGVDAIDEAVYEIVNGNMTGTVYNDVDEQTRQTVSALEKLLQGEIFTAKGNKNIYVDYIKVTSENAENFK